MMFPDNPFLVAAEELVNYFLTRSGAIRSDLRQSTSGEQSVNILLYPSEPPSPFGYMEIDISFDVGELSNLEFDRDFGNSDWIPDNGPLLIIERRYVVPRCDEIEPEEQAARMGQVLSSYAQPSLSIFADQWIDLTNRLAWVGGEEVEAVRAEVGFSDHYDLRQVHSTDWRREGQRMLDEMHDLCEAATGIRPTLVEI